MKSTQVVAVLLSCLIAGEDLAIAQTRPGLKIVVIEGEGAVHNIQTGLGRSPVVEVRDEDDKPVAGARLTFALPERGPSGSFFGAGTVLNVTTNEQGRATGAGFRPNSSEGRFQIRVTAAQGDRTGFVNITQTNVLPPGGSNDVVQSQRKFGRGKLIGVLAVGAIIAAVALTRGGNDTPATTTPGTTVTAGTVSVGTPR